MLKKEAANLKPAHGDRAYTMYHGYKWEGTLDFNSAGKRLTFNPDHYRHVHWPHDGPFIFVGYDAAIIFDPQAAAFYAPADAD